MEKIIITTPVHTTKKGADEQMKKLFGSMFVPIGLRFDMLHRLLLMPEIPKEVLLLYQ